MDATPQHPGVHYPPPLIYVVGFGVAWVLNRWRPLPITAGPSLARMIVTLVFFLAYLTLFVTAFTAFRRVSTTLIPNRPATAFVTEGPYQFTRNPMYVSLFALYIAVTSFANTWWPLIILPLVLLVVDRAVIAREERYLGAAFPSEYAAYRARVRRWL